MAARGLVDVLIPRGGAGLIDTVVRNSQVPVIETGVGNCHLFVDATADRQMALDILINAKVQRPSVCNAVETLLVHADVAADFLPTGARRVGRSWRYGARRRAGCRVWRCRSRRGLRLCPGVPVAGHRRGRGRLARCRAATHPPLQHRSQRDDRQSQTSAARFAAEIDAAAVMVNASSRFVDGGEFGFGAEIGISTQKLHARGPMGLRR